MFRRKKKHLIILPDYAAHSDEEFHEIRSLILKKAPDIRVSIVKPKHLNRWPWYYYSSAPIQLVALSTLKNFKPQKGHLLSGRDYSKFEQLTKIQDAGFDSVCFCKPYPDMFLDPLDWGPVVIIKPEHGSKGKLVRVYKTSKVKWNKFKDDANNWLIQKYIYTGPFPISYRVTTLCGKAMGMMKITNQSNKEPLDRTNETKAFSGHNPVSSTVLSKVALEWDEKIISFAEEIAQKVFPEVALLGIDVLQESSSGKLYIAEVNPFGKTWHFSSDMGRGIEQKNQIDLKSQGLIGKAADALIDSMAKVF